MRRKIRIWWKRRKLRRLEKEIGILPGHLPAEGDTYRFSFDDVEVNIDSSIAVLEKAKRRDPWAGR